jgi:hypothetical protein
MQTPPTPTNDSLYDAASDVALRLRAFDSYRRSQRRALTALKRRQPGFADSEYERALAAALVLFDTARRLVDTEYERMRASGPVAQWPEKLVPVLASRCPGFPVDTYLDLLNWMDIYYHQM